MSAYQYQAVTRDPTAVIGRRTVAAVVDGLIVSIPSFLVFTSELEYVEEGDSGVPLSDFCDALQDRSDANVCFTLGDRGYFAEDPSPVGGFLGLGLSLLLLVVVQAFTGWTPGKALLGIRTVGEDGQPPGLGKAIIRWLLLLIDTAPWCVPLVGFIVALTSTGHRRIGDMAAKTFVVSKADVGRPIAVPGLTPAYPVAPGYAGAPGGWGAPPGTPGAPVGPGAPGPGGPGSGDAWGAPPPAYPGSPGAAAPSPSAWAPAPSPSPGPSETPAPGRADDTLVSPQGPGPEPGASAPGPEAPAPAEPASAEPPSDLAQPEPAGAEAAPAPAAEPAPAEPAAAAPGAEPTAAPGAEPASGQAPGAEQPEAGTTAVPGEEPSPAEPAASETAEPTAAAETAGAASAEAGAAQGTYNPQWDAARGTYIVWEPGRGKWLGWDDNAKEWKPL